MALTIEQRVEKLEKAFAQMASTKSARKPHKKAWQSTFGLSQNDPGFGEMARFGRDYRKRLKLQDNGAGS
ncbi:MAG: hypothetical protein C5B50_24725 [Verrucomicrobia bacterium]|nr:MAG: hypothetical protein C5B50_24725 [Verrucomicrobiota bacterium]